MLEKPKKNIWEKIFHYPSFDKRFIFLSLISFLIFLVLFNLIVNTEKIVSTFDQKVSLVSLFIQTITLFITVVAVYFALKQLVETRFIALDNNARDLLKSRQYNRANKNWKEAFYIKTEGYVFLNMMESFLLCDDIESFDIKVKSFVDNPGLKKEVFVERIDEIIFVMLISVRYFLREDLGEGKKYLTQMLNLHKEIEFELKNFIWTFTDIQGSSIYISLDQQSNAKQIIDNLFSYFEKRLNEQELEKFKTGNFLLS